MQEEHFTKQDWTDLKVDFKMKGYMNDMEKAATLDIQKELAAILIIIKGYMQITNQERPG